MDNPECSYGDIEKFGEVSLGFISDLGYTE
jgi:hypothetical protein